MKSNINKALIGGVILAFLGASVIAAPPPKPQIVKCTKGDAKCKSNKAAKMKKVSAKTGKAPVVINNNSPAAKPIKKTK